MKRALWLVVGLILAASLVSGCGRIRMPGKQQGPVAVTSTEIPAGPQIAKQPWFEAGPKEAKVRVVAFFPMDEARKPLMDLLKSLAKEHDGKVYVKYTDITTPEGTLARQRAGGGGSGLLINTQAALVIDAEPQPYRVEFNQDMGRWWTADDLKAAVAQEVARAYGK